MKTLKCLKITSILQALFCLCCILADVGFIINYYYPNRWLLIIENLIMYGLVINPVGIVSFVCGMCYFWQERKYPEQKRIIGCRWLWFFVWFIVTFVFWVSLFMFTIEFGGIM